MIRKANVFDANELTKMWDSMYDEVITRSSMRKEYDNLTSLFINMVARIESQEWAVIIYEVEGNIAGFSMGRLHYPLYNKCNVILECEVIYVYPEYRGLAIHEKLMNEGRQWGINNNATQFEFSGPYNEVLVKFWDKLGYEPVAITYRQKEAI